MPLSERQTQAIQALDWLLDLGEHRREGRTVALAVAHIRQAARYPTRAIRLVDPTAENESMQRLFIHTVSSLINDDGYLLTAAILRGVGRETTLTLNIPRPIDWLPVFPEIDTPLTRVPMRGFEVIRARGELAQQFQMQQELMASALEVRSMYLDRLDLPDVEEGPPPKTAWERLADDRPSS